jgi:hypothetical protein
MAAHAFRVFFGDRSAGEEELRLIEEISVEQTMDRAWEARIRLGLCLDEQGRWRRTDEAFSGPFSRVRVEIGLDGDFAPLIDGPVASVDTDMDARPGRSALTLVVQDDSVLLDREEDVEVFEERGESSLAEETFRLLPEITETRIQSPGDTPRVIVRRGTPMAFLSRLARAHGWHAYVLPGERRGTSVGCYLPDPAGPPELPPLTLMGPERNLADAEVSRDDASPERTRAYTLRLDDQAVVGSDTGQQAQTLLRDFPAVPLEQAAVRLLPPEENDREDLDTRTAGRARRNAFAYRMTARVVPGCYGAVLGPYRKVALKAGDTPLSGDWLLTRVTHRITPSLYTQELEAKSDSRSDPAAPSLGGAAGLSPELSASLSLF